ncbi:MAG: TRAP transporter large permease [Candidatus Rokubacteria bacterium]|nr:TRAP transporter large permease [Candidatus Rokubacteria bacterium]
MPPLAITLGVFFVLFVLRVPVAFTLAAATIVGLVLSPSPIPLSTLATAMWQGINSFVLLALPFFILMGDLALASGVTRRLVDFAKAFVGHISGGLAHVSVVVNMIMAGMSGSDLADAAATGSVLIPAMKRVGYPVGYAASIIAGAATIGPLIPPSIAFIIFAAATDTSVGRLFLGGAIPGVMLGLLLMAQAYVVARRRGYPREPRVPMRERVRLTWISLPVLAIPVFVLGSIIAGVATPTEAAVVGALAVLVVGGFLYRELTLHTVARQFLATLRTTASIFFIIATAAAFARVLTLYGAATALADWITGLTTSPALFLLGVNVVFVLLGCVVDTVPILLVFVPLLMPTVKALGIDPVHFGVVTVFNLLIGLITPPYGLTMYLLCRISGISLAEFWRYAWPIFTAMVFSLMLVTFIPALTTWLPSLVMP